MTILQADTLRHQNTGALRPPPPSLVSCRWHPPLINMETNQVAVGMEVDNPTVGKARYP